MLPVKFYLGVNIDAKYKHIWQMTAFVTDCVEEVDVVFVYFSEEKGDYPLHG